MHSIRTKIVMLTVCVIVIAMSIATLLAAVAIKDLGSSSSNQILYLLCRTGERNLDSYFDSVEQSVETVSGYAESDLSDVGLDQLGAHIELVKEIFEKTAGNTAGVLTYYYRIDPEVSATDKGFWFVDLDGEGFVEHEVTDITLYDTEDQSALVWFTVPKATGSAIWLPPYVTDNLDVYVLSYNVPIYKGARFIGVIGIEIDYSTMVDTVDSITLYDNGYAFINDAEGTLIYHPHMSVEELTGENRPQTPAGLLNAGTFFAYEFEGVEKQAVWLPLDNGMRLNVTVPIAEINSNWQRLITEIIAASALLLVVFVLITLRFAGRITRPLRKLTTAAEQVNEGNYDVELNYDGNDEVGLLTRTFSQLIRHLKVYIRDLNSLAYADALTSVHNKGAFDIYVRDLEARLTDPDEQPRFAVGVFDCDRLKSINDQYGHDKGDIYLKTASALICRVFKHSSVFRTGGDEFTIIMQTDDYQDRVALTALFEAKMLEINAAARNRWDEVNLSMGLAVYDPDSDLSVVDVVRRADRLMYENKHVREAERPD